MAATKIRLLLTCSLLLLLRAASGSSSGHRHYYTSVAKLGLVRGLTWTSSAMTTPDGRAQSVVALLGLPYAAPPTGLLRFMPPGAVSQSQLTNGNVAIEQHQLMPGGQLVSVRDHSRFGHECIHLPDWLQQEQRKGEELTETRGSSRNSSGREEKRARQAEDCLNLNAFIPINEQPNSSSMRQQINSNYSPKQQLRADEQTNTISAPTSSLSHPQQQNYTNQLQHSLRHPVNQDATKLWPLPTSADARLPLLVVFHGRQTQPSDNAGNSKPNSLSYLHVAQRTNSILVTFNCRSGLLGFLPFSDEGVRRHNHAIWDQIGALHWLKHNGAHALGADTQNVTLVAADNQAARQVQLLAMSPHAKGLFNRVLLVHDDANAKTASGEQVDELATSSAAKFQEARRKLAPLLGQVVAAIGGQQVNSTSGERPPIDERHAFEFVQRAELSQLAQIDAQLRRSAPEPLIALANAPTLDDRLLFPHHQQLAMALNDLSSADKLRSQLDYCTYLRQLYAGQSDPLNLIGFERDSSAVNRSRHQQQAAGSWRRDASRSGNSSAAAGGQAVSEHKRTLAAASFSHLRHLTDLYKVLSRQNMSAKSSRARVKRRVGIASDHQLLLPSSNQQKKYQVIEELLELLASFDLMIGYFSFPEAAGDDAIQQVTVNNDGLPNIFSILAQQSTSISRQLVALFHFADLHFISTFSSPAKMSQYCDMFSPDQRPSKANHIFLASSSRSSLISSAANVDDRPVPKNYQVNNWLIDAAHNQQSTILITASNFVRYGSQDMIDQSVQRNLIPQYNSLTRQFRDFSADDSITGDNYSSQNLQEKIMVQLDLLPYLSGLAQAANSQGRIGIDDDLLTCLDDIDTAINKSSPQRAVQEQIGCLASVATKLRNQLHQLASDDLEPLIRAASRLSQADSPRAASSITTRNLVTEPVHTTFQQQSTDQRDESALSASVQPAKSSKTFAASSPLTALLRQVTTKPLTVIIFAGLIIFIINLAIVAAIAFRSAQTRRRVQNQENSVASTNLNQVTASQRQQLRPGVLRKRSTLKQTNITQKDPQEHSLQPAIKSNSCKSLGRANKQLTFSLPGASVHDEQLVEVHVPPIATCPVHNPEPGNFNIETLSQQQEPQTLNTEMSNICNEHSHLHNHYNDELAERTMYNFADDTLNEANLSNQNNELVLSAASILDSYDERMVSHHHQQQQKQQLQMKEWQRISDNDEKHMYLDTQKHLCDFQADHSPVGYLSHSTATTTTSGTYKELGRLANGSIASTAKFSSGNRIQPATNQQSPASSTTLSITPLQLETIHHTHCPSQMDQSSYQFCPSDLIYQQTVDQPGVLMLDRSSDASKVLHHCYHHHHHLSHSHLQQHGLADQNNVSDINADNS